MTPLSRGGFLILFALVVIFVDEAQPVMQNGHWSVWSHQYTPCSQSCDGGTHKRVRSCTNPKPSGGGSECKKQDDTNGMLEWEVSDCNTQTCWENEWGEWSNCSKWCGRGVERMYAMCGNETCTGPQLQVQERPCNTWVKNTTICPDPCVGVKCPEYAVCKDESTEEDPVARCTCTMGYEMIGDAVACIRPPPTEPTPRPIPSLPPEQKVVATVISKSASIIIIIMVSITLALFLLLKIFTPDRVIQMNMEIALLSAHIMLMVPFNITSPTMCRILSILVHFFFTACFMFMLLEALHMYSLVAFVVKKNGMMTRIQNTVFGWGMSAFIILCCMCFQYDNYGGRYHCWTQMDTNLVFGQYIPILTMMIITFTLIEAAGAADYKELKGIDQDQLLSAKISQRTNLIIMPLVFSHWMVGMLSEYEQNLPLYGTFSILNGVTGVVVFLLHCSNNQQVRQKLSFCFKSAKGKVKS